MAEWQMRYVGRHRQGHSGSVIFRSHLGQQRLQQKEKKTAKYSQLSRTCMFTSIAMETFGPINSQGLEFLSDLGRRISQVSDDVC